MNKLEQVRRTAEAMGICDGRIVEIRALDVVRGTRGYGQTWSGYFDNVDALVDQVARVIDSASGIYFTPNEPNPALLARSKNKIQETGKRTPTTADHDILRRRWILVDLDPVRPAGISSSADELEHAKDMAFRIARASVDAGWPEPICACSGNGYHLLWACNWEVNEAETEDVRVWLERLREVYKTEHVDVDRTVFNPARIWKMYGTRSTKGDSTEERPHRISHLVYVPDEIEEVEKHMLDFVEPAETKPKREKPKPRKSRFDIQKFLQDHLSGQVAEPKDWKHGGRKWVLYQCPFNSDHADGSAYVAEQPNGAIVAGCLHNSCRWEWSDLREHFDPKKDRAKLDVEADVGLPRFAKGVPLDWSAPTPNAEYNDDWTEAPIQDHSHWHLSEVFCNDLLRGYDSTQPVVSDGSALWRYTPQHGVWERVSESEFAKVVGARDLEMWTNGEDEKIFRVTSSRVPSSIWKIALQRYERPRFFLNAERGGLQFRNGFVRVDNKNVHLLRHSPDRRQQHFVDENFDRGAKAPRWQQALVEWFGDDEEGKKKAKLLQMFYGACLFDLATKFGKVLFLTGEGANGKSVAISALSGVLPESLRSAVSPQNLSTTYSNPEYYVDMLRGSRLNVCADIDDSPMLRSDLFKKIVTGDEVIGREIRESPGAFHPTAGHIFSANELPRSKDKSHGFWRRVMVLEFETEISEADRDQNLSAKLTKERDGIIAWAAQGAFELCRDGWVTPASSVRRLNEWRTQSDLVALWISEEVLESEDTTKSTELFDLYCEWCEENRVKTGSQMNWAKSMGKHFDKIRKSNGNHYLARVVEPWERTSDAPIVHDS